MTGVRKTNIIDQMDNSLIYTIICINLLFFLFLYKKFKKSTLNFSLTKEKELLISQNKYKQLFIQSQDAIMTLSPPTWGFTSCNPATLKLFNVKNEEDFIKMGPSDISPERQPSGELSSLLAQKVILKAMTEGSSEFDWVHVDTTGKPIQCKVLLSRVQEKESYLQATVRDVSKEKELLNQLSESKEYLSLAIHGTNLGIWDWDLRDNSVIFDAKWAEMLGYNINEIEMKLSTWESKVHPSDIAQCHEDIKKYLDKKTTYYENIHRMKHKKGHWVYILDRGRFSKYDDNGNPIKFTGTHLDITDVMISKQKLDLFFKKSTYGFAFCDMNGKFIEINQEFERISGYTKDELNSLSYWDLTPEKYKKNEEEQLFLLKDKGQCGPYRKEYKRKNNELIPIRLNGFIVEDCDGSKGIWYIIEDISSQVKLEQELDTQKRIALHNAKLAAIGKLSAGVGHEINNPLAIIQGNLEIIRMMSDEKTLNQPEFQLRLERSFKGIERIANIVTGLRTFSRIDDSLLTEVNLSALIHETKDLLIEIFNKDQIEFLFDIEDNLFIKGNRGRIQQVLINILNNARDAMHHAHKKTINLQAKRDSNNTIEISISDSGTGVPDHLKEIIFDPFFTTKELNKGTGIGLALVASIIKEHDGVIKIDDSYAGGARFVINLTPISKPEIKTKENTKIIVKEQLKGNILVVDDEVDLRDILSHLLTIQGFNVTAMENGLKALNHLKENPSSIDFILSDFKMPELNGLELAKRVRQIDGFKGKFVCITGGVDNDLSKEPSIDAILAKPYVQDDIIKIIKKVSAA